MSGRIVKLISCKRGNSTAEYGLLLALIASATLVATTHLGLAASSFFNSVTSAL